MTLQALVLTCAAIAAVTALLLVHRQALRSRDLGVLNAGRYRSLARATSALVWQATADGQFCASVAWRRFTGLPEPEQVGQGWLSSVHPDDLTRVKAAWYGAVLQGDPFQVPCRLRFADTNDDEPGSGWRHVMLRAVPLREHDGKILEWVGTVTDDDDRVRATKALRTAEEKYEKAFRLNPDAIILTGLDRPRLIEANAGFNRITGFTREDFQGRNGIGAQLWVDMEERTAYINELVRNGSVTNMRVRLRQRDGGLVHGLISSQIIEVEGERCVLSTVRDISMQVQAELETERLQRELEDSNRKLERLARQDGLTGVYNRRAFDEALANELRRAARGGMALSLVMLDVDCFKQFNDRYGHLAGDDCLRRLAVVLEAVFQRSGDFVARYGGEEFAVILPDCDRDAAARTLELVRERVLGLGIAHQDGPADGRISVSAGVATLGVDEAGATQALLGEGSDPAALLLGAADAALYRAKAEGRNCVRFAASPYGALAAEA